MPVIDSDAHVVESEHTWDYIEPASQKYRPLIDPEPPKAGEFRRWLVDGKVAGFRRPTLSEMELQRISERTGRNVVTPQAANKMDDIGLRLRHMDQLGIDIEVLHNSIFILQVTDRADVEVPICRAWNRWMAEVWKQGQGRLRWTCVPPTLSQEDALAEIRFGKEHGAVGVLMRAIEGDRTIVDPYFYPIYEEAERLNMPIAIHIANGNPWFADFYSNRYETGGNFGRLMAPVAVACHQIIMSQLPEMFPSLRWVMIEAGAQWLPWVVSEAQRRLHGSGREWPQEGFPAFNIYVTCQTNNDMPFIVKYAGEDRLLIGTDYGHSDLSSEIDAITIFRKTSGLEPRVVEKIVDDNPRACFGI